MAFQCEEATKLVKGQRVPLSRGDIATETGLTPAQVRRALVALEVEGYAERRGGDGGLRKGEITIHCWAIPRPPKQDADVRENSRPALEVQDLPPYLQRWIKRLHLDRMPEPEVLAKAGALCETLSAAETELRQLLKPASESRPRTPEKTARGTDASPFGVRLSLPHIRMKDRGKKEDKKEARSVGPVVAPTDRQTDALLLAITETGITERLKDSPSSALLARIKAALKGRGYDALKIRIHARFEAITGLGMLEDLAKDVAASADDPPRTFMHSHPGAGSRTDAVKQLAIQNLERTGKLL
jgi:hypothetical protein